MNTVERYTFTIAGPNVISMSYAKEALNAVNDTLADVTNPKMQIMSVVLDGGQYQVLAYVDTSLTKRDVNINVKEVPYREETGIDRTTFIGEIRDNDKVYHVFASNA